MEHLGEELARIPGVVAVTLGGSRARGEETEGSDWDFGLYYRDHIDTAAVRALPYEAHVVEPGEWGRLMNGGAWMLVDGQRVDLLYRDLATVEHWTAEAEAGRFEIDAVPGYLAGMASYVLAGEAGLGKVLHGTIPQPSFPEALRAAGHRVWHMRASFSLIYASRYAASAHPAMCGGMLARAALEAGYGRLCAKGDWALNDKRVLSAAGLWESHAILGAVGSRPRELEQSVARLRNLLDLAPPSGLHLDALA